MKLYSICLIKNEDDIIRECLVHAAQYCDKIFVLDNGSIDQTWEIVQDLAIEYPQIIPFKQLSIPFRDGMRSIVYNAFHHELSDQDWWMRLDADEFFYQDPRPLMAKAIQEKVDVIKAWQIQFYYTEVDRQAWLLKQDDRHLPIAQRRRFYKIDWREIRLFRNLPDQPWNEDQGPQWPDGLDLNNVCSEHIFNRHYQYRDPDQIQKRLDLRRGHIQFGHVKTQDWQSLIRSSQWLHIYKEEEKLIFNPLDYYLVKLKAYWNYYWDCWVRSLIDPVKK